MIRPKLECLARAMQRCLFVGPRARRCGKYEGPVHHEQFIHRRYRRMATLKKLTKRGFTLIELMIVVVIIGILASLAIYGVQKYVANSKSAEARMMLGRISKDAIGAYESEEMQQGVLALNGSAAISRQLCVGAPSTIPSAIASVSAMKYQPNPGEWTAPGWACLKTVISTPIYYMYGYTSDATPNTPSIADDEFAGTATGDLDGDGNTSLFTLAGKVVADASNGLSVIVAPTVSEAAPEE